MMMGYYWLVLRNKRFHQYNRFYLLAIALLSWIVPLIKIRWSHPVVSQDPQVIQFLSVVADGNSQIDESLTNNGFQWSWDTTATLIYVSIAGVLLIGMLRAFFRLFQLLRKHSCKNVGDVYLILTQARGTPFSFFRYIFWNEEIDLRSEAGKQILQHELTHVQQKHSIDKVCIQSMLVAGWFNPFFWLLKKEMNMIHEFIADKKAVNNGDTASLAQMLLTAAYPQQQFALTHPFFFSPIKRRLQMLTNNRNPRFSYIRRLIVLPLLAIVVVLFAFRSKELRANATLSVASVVENVVDAVSAIGSKDAKPSNIPVFNNAMLNRTYTVVIDAGHGGKDRGAMALDGTTESEITLQLAKTIRNLNTNENIQIILTRDADIFQNVVKTAELANQNHPDLFVSLHCNDGANVKSSNGKESASLKTGIEFFIPAKEKAAEYERSQLLASYLATSMNTLDEPMLGIKTRQKGIWVLNNVKSPAVLIETGFMTDKSDLKKLKDAAYQKQMAESILQGINNYLSKPVQTKLNLISLGLDTIIFNEDVLKLEKSRIAFASKNSPGNKPLVILDGKKADYKILETLGPNLIDAVDVLKDASATATYGDEGKNGVILITTKEYAKARAMKSSANKNSAPITMQGQDITIAANSTTEMNFGLPGVKIGDPVIITPFCDKSEWVVSTQVVEDNMVKIKFINPTNKPMLVLGNAYKIVAIKSVSDIQKIEQEEKINGNKVVQAITDKGFVTNTTTGIQPDQSNLHLVTDGAGNVHRNWQTRTNKIPARKYPDSLVWLPNKPRTGYPLSALVFVDGVKADMNSITPSEISSITVLKDKTAVEKYGEEGKKGVIEIITKKTADAKNNTDTRSDVVFTQVQIQAEFPGGKATWIKYLERNLQRDIIMKNGGPRGKYTVVVSFTVDKEGNVSNVEALNDPGYGTKDEAIRVIVKGPKWLPAVQNGKKVNSVHKQAVTWMFQMGTTNNNPAQDQPEKKLYYYFCDSKPWSGKNLAPKSGILYTEVKKISCDEAAIRALTNEWANLVKSICTNANGCTSDLNSYTSYEEAKKQLDNMLRKYSDTVLYDCRKIPSFGSAFTGAKLDPAKSYEPQ